MVGSSHADRTASLFSDLGIKVISGSHFLGGLIGEHSNSGSHFVRHGKPILNICKYHMIDKMAAFLFAK